MKKSKIIYLSVFFGAVLLSAFLGYYMAKGSEPIFSQKYIESQAVSVAANDFLKKDAMIEIVSDYAFCGHKETVKGNASYFGFAGLTLDELLQKKEFATVKKFSQSGVVLEVKPEEFCPKHFTLKFDGDELYIYKTDSKTGELEKYLELNIYRKGVYPVYRDELDIGRVFENTNEINRYLKEIRK